MFWQALAEKSKNKYTVDGVHFFATQAELNAWAENEMNKVRLVDNSCTCVQTCIQCLYLYTVDGVHFFATQAELNAWAENEMNKVRLVDKTRTCGQNVQYLCYGIVHEGWRALW
jgi:hypothetical protein